MECLGLLTTDIASVVSTLCRAAEACLKQGIWRFTHQVDKPGVEGTG